MGMCTYVEASGQHGTFSLLLFTHLLFYFYFWFCFFFSLCVGGYFTYIMSVHHVHALCLERPEKDLKFWGL